MEQIRRAASFHEFDLSLRRSHARCFVYFEDERVIPMLLSVFGIDSFSRVESESAIDLDAMEKSIQSFIPHVRGKSFCVRVKHSGQLRALGCKSPEIEARLGAQLMQVARKVELRQPEVRIDVELDKNRAYFSAFRWSAASGFPLGSQGRALTLFSGGFDSAVAAWSMMRRGVAMDYFLLSLGGERQEQEVLAVADELVGRWAHGGSSRLWIIPGEDLVEILQSHIRQDMIQVVLKRLLYRMAQELRCKIPDCQAVVTGESIGQVSSQTLKNLAVISESIRAPLFQPLIAATKEEIIAKAREIGIYQHCEKVREYCGLSQGRPASAAPLSAVLRQEARLPPDLIESTLLPGLKVIDLPAGKSRANDLPKVSCQNLPEGATVIDCRSREQYCAWHVPGALHMEFTMLKQAFMSLDKKQSYLLYCDFGLQTHYLAQLMRSQASMQAFSFQGGAKALRKYLDSQ